MIHQSNGVTPNGLDRHHPSPARAADLGFALQVHWASMKGGVPEGIDYSGSCLEIERRTTVWQSDQSRHRRDGPG